MSASLLEGVCGRGMVRGRACGIVLCTVVVQYRRVPGVAVRAGRPSRSVLRTFVWLVCAFNSGRPDEETFLSIL